MSSFCLLGLVVCIPVFVMKISYDSVSFDESYAWILSLAYSSGSVASILVVLAWTSLLVVGLLLTSVIKMKKERFLQLFDKSHDTITSEKKVYLDTSTSSSIHVSILGMSMQIERNVYALILLSFNAIVVLGANALYVYCLLIEFSPTTTTVIQIGFALFTLFWKHAVMSHFVFNPSETLARRVMLKTRMDIFSAVIAPILVLLVTDPDCFRVRECDHWHTKIRSIIAIYLSIYLSNTCCFVLYCIAGHIY
jgi:hypothetical protein